MMEFPGAVTVGVQVIFRGRGATRWITIDPARDWVENPYAEDDIAQAARECWLMLRDEWENEQALRVQALAVVDT